VRAARDRESRLDLVTFQLGELDRAALKTTRGRDPEDVELAALRQVLASAERVERLCAESYASLYERDDAILAGLWRRVAPRRGAGRARSAVQAVPRDRDGIKSQLEDLAGVPAQVRGQHRSVAARLQQVEERLALLER
jgi:DNA repair ATPase RecN